MANSVSKDKLLEIVKNGQKVRVDEILSTVPNKPGEYNDSQILRAGILAELDAINLYEQMAQTATNEKVKKTLLDIAKEEKTHIGEFQALLLNLDKEYKQEMINGKKEVS